LHNNGGFLSLLLISGAFFMIKIIVRAATAASLLCLAMPASATTWVDWTSATATTASGVAGSTTVSFTSSSTLHGVQTTPATNYYTPWPSGALAPTNTDIIRLSAAGTRTLTFSRPVSNLVFALVSWNVPGAVNFSSPFSNPIIGRGFWGGTGSSITPNSTFTGFTANGEVHGTIRFQGTINSLTFTSPSENWHGFTVGFNETNAVPEPATWLTMLLGFGLIGGAARRKKRQPRLELMPR
jgi:hypothetical protein